MATVVQVIEWAMRDAGILAEGESASSEGANDAFETLKQMLALWQVENVYIYAQQETSFAPNGATSYTFGSGGTGGSTRLAKVDQIFWRYNSLDYPVDLLDTFQEWESISQKTQAGEPLCAFYLPSYASGTLYLCPQPSTGTIYLVSNVAFPTLSTLATTISLPNEYILPIRLNLAVMLGGMFGMKVNPDLKKQAEAAWKVVKRNNLRIQPLPMPGAIPTNVRSDIFTGT